MKVLVRASVGVFLAFAVACGSGSAEHGDDVVPQWKADAHRLDELAAAGHGERILLAIERMGDDGVEPPSVERFVDFARTAEGANLDGAIAILREAQLVHPDASGLTETVLAELSAKAREIEMAPILERLRNLPYVSR